MSDSHRRACAAIIAAGAALAVLAPIATAQRGLHLSSVRCYLSATKGCRNIVPGGKVSLVGTGFRRGAKVYFTTTGGKRAVGAARIVSSRVIHARVPASAATGLVYVREPNGARSNSRRVTVHRPARPPSGATAASGTAFDGNGMWIWYVSQSGGSAPAILAAAQQHAISTVFIKSSDGTNWWSQFSPALVAQLKAGGLHVCAWQYVYGSAPAAEAALGARAAQTGADCLAIDAEQQYEGRYSQAQTYIDRLRAAVGAQFPLGLASFPYVDYHPALPYSVFLGPNGAQFNVPQIYWKAIGVSVTTAVNHTYSVNAPYGRPLAPLGQAYDNTSGADITRFRQLTAARGAPGVSWWDWQEATASEWSAIGRPLTQSAAASRPAPLTLSQGAKGDLVVWAQEHLRGAGISVPVSGSFDGATRAAVVRFQRSAGLSAGGRIDAATWRALLRLKPASWSVGAVHSAGSGGRAGPPSASLPARRYEIPPHLHQG